MNNVNRTLYIPLYGKAYVSKKRVILHDKKAEEIWDAEGFELKGKARSKWLAYNMGMRSAVFDQWLKKQMDLDKDAVIIHIGCGMDSRVLRVGTRKHAWYDVDFPDVIRERKRYYEESGEYHMVASDARNYDWIEKLPKNENAIIVMEGVSMYFQTEELIQLLKHLTGYFQKISVLMDCYTVFAAKASKYKNPVNDVGVTVLHGMDDPKMLEKDTGLLYIKEHDLTPDEMIDELSGVEKVIFKKMFAGKLAKKIYRLYEYESDKK